MIERLKKEPKPTLAELDKKYQKLLAINSGREDEIMTLRGELSAAETREKERVEELQGLIIQMTLKAERAAGYIDRVLEDDAIRDGTDTPPTNAPMGRTGPATGHALPDYSNSGTVTGRFSSSKPWWKI